MSAATPFDGARPPLWAARRLGGGAAVERDDEAGRVGVQ